MIDLGSVLQTSVTLAGFLIGVSTFLPKGLDEEWFAYLLFLVPSPILFLITAALSAYGSDLALPFFIGSIVILISLFIGLGIWGALEKRAEQQLKERLRSRNPELFSALIASS